MSNIGFVVYADLNCPFCFALYRRLMDLGFIDRVEWRGIEHAPNARYQVGDTHVQTELRSEISRLRELAHEIDISVPGGRPNSRLATELITEALAVDREKAIEFRHLIYSALWNDGLDIADPKLLERLRIEAELPPLSVSESTLRTLAEWQQQWEQGDFARNTPALLTRDGNKILGLPNVELIQSFFSGDDAVFEDGAFCYLKPRQKILIATESDDIAAELSNSYAGLYQIEFAQHGGVVFDSCVSDNPPDLVLIDSNLSDPNGFSTCVKIKDHERSHSIPVIFFSRDKSVKTEVKSFDMGASDFIYVPCSPDVLRARSRVLLQLKRTTDLLEQFSKLDSLTEIPNRREFDRIFEKEWMRAKRYHKPLSIILLDVDYFKKFNDNYGHLEGDECLKQVAQIIESSIRRPHDTVARYGGEEFVIILPETDRAGATSVAEKIARNLIRTNIRHDHSDVADCVTASQGVTTIFPSAKLHPKSAMDAADSALYKAKEAGRNRVMFGELNLSTTDASANAKK